MTIATIRRSPTVRPGPTVPSVPTGPAVHGGTALGADPGHPRHLLGNALRAVRVFAVSAAEVVLLGAQGRPCEGGRSY